MNTFKELKPLSDEKVYLNSKELIDWQYSDGKISRVFGFLTYADSIGFVYDLLQFFDESGIYPEVRIKNEKVQFIMPGGAENELCEEHFLIARKLNDHYEHYEIRRPDSPIFD